MPRFALRREVGPALLMLIVGLTAASCSKPSATDELQAAVEACRSGMESPNPIDKKKELSGKGFSEVSYADAPTDTQKLIDQIKQGTVSGRHVEQSEPLALILKGDAQPSMYFTWINLDTTGATSTKGYSRLCLVGPLTDEQTRAGLQQVEDYALKNDLFVAKAEKEIFGSRKAQVHDHLQLTSAGTSSNLLTSGSVKYSVVSDSKYLSFYSNAIFGSAN